MATVFELLSSVLSNLHHDVDGSNQHLLDRRKLREMRGRAARVHHIQIREVVWLVILVLTVSRHALLADAVLQLHVEPRLLAARAVSGLPCTSSPEPT